MKTIKIRLLYVFLGLYLQTVDVFSQIGTRLLSSQRVGYERHICLELTNTSRQTIYLFPQRWDVISLDDWKDIPYTELSVYNSFSNFIFLDKSPIFYKALKRNECDSRGFPSSTSEVCVLNKNDTILLNFKFVILNERFIGIDSLYAMLSLFYIKERKKNTAQPSDLRMISYKRTLVTNRRCGSAAFTDSLCANLNNRRFPSVAKGSFKRIRKQVVIPLRPPKPRM